MEYRINYQLLNRTPWGAGGLIMLAYYINNIPLSLGADSSVRITYYNPACFPEEIPGDVAMGIEIPANDINRAILGNPERFEKYIINNDREFKNFEIRFSGKLLLSGTLVIQNTTAETYSGWCRNNVGNLGKEHREKFIYDIPAFKQLITFVNKANYNPLTDPYGCPKHYNSEFFRDKGHMVELTRKVPNPDYVDLTLWQEFWQHGDFKLPEPYIDEKYTTEAFSAAFAKSTAFFVNDLWPDGSVKLANSFSTPANIDKDLFINVLSPMLFLNFIIEMLLRDAHFFIDSNAIKAHPDLQKLILYNNFDVTHVEFETEFIESIPIYYDDDYIQGYFSTPQTIASIQNIKRTLDSTFVYSDLLPKIQLKDFFLSIQNLLNVCFHFRNDGKVDIVDKEAIITSTPIDLRNYLVGKWDMGEKKDVTLKFLFNHDSDDIMFSEKWTDIDDFREFEGDPVATFADLALIGNPKFGEIRYVTGSNAYVQYKWTALIQKDPKTGDDISIDIVDWALLTTGFQNGFFNRKRIETEEIKTSFSTLAGNQNLMSLHKGNMETMRIEYQNFTPRLMFYIGNNIAKNETDNIALDWEKKDKGLLATRWPKWNRFWSQRQPVTINADLPINMIEHVSRNITNRFSSREGTFIIETMETEFQLETIGITKTTGFKDSYMPLSTGLDEHWLPGNLVLDDTLIDFTKLNLNFDTNLDLFPFNTL